MHVLRNADALILDLRTNDGGSPEMVARVISYLLVQPDLPLFAIAHRSGPAELYATASRSLPDANGSRPLYVLMSTRTFSAGEGLAFLLHERKRGEIVGETTAGAASDAL